MDANIITRQNIIQKCLIQTATTGAITSHQTGTIGTAIKIDDLRGASSMKQQKMQSITWQLPHQLLPETRNNETNSNSSSGLGASRKNGSSRTKSEPDDVGEGGVDCDTEDDDEDDDADDGTESSCSTSASADLNSNEIPIWIRGEQRWISGVTDQTMCSDLIEALLMDEGVNSESGGIKIDDYVITERWRRVEQVLDNKTKILKIWLAWGEAQNEVRLTLRKVDNHQHHQQRYGCNNPLECDSGRGSPTGSINSAIVRRRRHRASKSTTAWITQAQTIHPKSQKATIEKLMKLIIEQGETIQQQLSKLRDREFQITRIEEDRHHLREKEHGKNYLLETYLNGLHEANEKEIATGNSDSGVHTEDATPSPEMGLSPSYENKINSDDVESANVYTKRKSRSHREAHLMRKHEAYKELNTVQNENQQVEPIDQVTGDNVEAQIEMLEKLITLNKHLQHEEELVVRLSAKIRRYESEDPALNEHEIKEALKRVNNTIDHRSDELQLMDKELASSNDILQTKASLLNHLNEELQLVEHEHGKLHYEAVARAATQNYQLEYLQDSNFPQETSSNKKTNEQPDNYLNLNREYLAENIYNISKMILKSSTVPNSGVNQSNDYEKYQNQSKGENQLLCMSTGNFVDDLTILNQQTTMLQQYPNDYRYPLDVQQQQQQQHYITDQQQPFINDRNINPLMIFHKESNNNLLKCSEKNFNIVTASNIKLGPKKLINDKNIIEIDTNLTSGMNLIKDDCTQLGTLV